MPGQPIFSEGELLAGKYRIGRKLGEGGMGAVYLAENVDIGRQVAIKVLNPEVASDPNVLGRFKQEARAAGAIGHPGIVDILDMGSLPTGGPFIVMERLDGQTLRERLREQVRPSLPDLVNILSSVLDTLGAAHDAGIIHRDLKPDNIFLVSRPVPCTKILDFGISKFRGATDVSLTRTGMVMGTPLYMSPEQARGSKDVGVGADIYSIGAVLYEALAGLPPFPGETFTEVLAKLLTEPPPPLSQARSDLPRPLIDLVEGMLSKSIEGRPPSARDAANRLRTALSWVPSSSVSSTGPTFVPPIPAQTPSPTLLQAFQTGPELRPPRENPADPRKSVDLKPERAAQVAETLFLEPANQELEAAIQKPRLLPWVLGLVGLIGAVGIAAWYFNEEPARAPVAATQPAAVIVAPQPSPPPTPPVQAAPEPPPVAPSLPPVEAPVVAQDDSPKPLATSIVKKIPRTVAAVAKPPAPAPIPAGPSGKLTVGSTPWMEVFVDGKSVGVTPVISVAITPGTHAIRLVNSELDLVRTMSVEVAGGENKKVAYQLEKGKLHIAVKPWANVTVDGKSLGPTPFPDPEVFEGTHHLVLENPLLGKSITQTVVVPANGRADVKLDMQ